MPSPSKGTSQIPDSQVDYDDSPKSGIASPMLFDDDGPGGSTVLDHDPLDDLIDDIGSSVSCRGINPAFIEQLQMQQLQEMNLGNQQMQAQQMQQQYQKVQLCHHQQFAQAANSSQKLDPRQLHAACASNLHRQMGGTPGAMQISGTPGGIMGTSNPMMATPGAKQMMTTGTSNPMMATPGAKQMMTTPGAMVRPGAIGHMGTTPGAMQSGGIPSILQESPRLNANMLQQIQKLNKSPNPISKLQESLQKSRSSPDPKRQRIDQGQGMQTPSRAPCKQVGANIETYSRSHQKMPVSNQKSAAAMQSSNEKPQASNPNIPASNRKSAASSKRPTVQQPQTSTSTAAKPVQLASASSKSTPNGSGMPAGSSNQSPTAFPSTQAVIPATQLIPGTQEVPESTPQNMPLTQPNLSIGKGVSRTRSRSARREQKPSASEKKPSASKKKQAESEKKAAEAEAKSASSEATGSKSKGRKKKAEFKIDEETEQRGEATSLNEVPKPAKDILKITDTSPVKFPTDSKENQSKEADRRKEDQTNDPASPAGTEILDDTCNTQRIEESDSEGRRKIIEEDENDEQARILSKPARRGKKFLWDADLDGVTQRVPSTQEMFHLGRQGQGESIPSQMAVTPPLETDDAMDVGESIPNLDMSKNSGGDQSESSLPMHTALEPPPTTEILVGSIVEKAATEIVPDIGEVDMNLNVIEEEEEEDDLLANSPNAAKARGKGRKGKGKSVIEAETNQPPTTNLPSTNKLPSEFQAVTANSSPSNYTKTAMNREPKKKPSPKASGKKPARVNTETDIVMADPLNISQDLYFPSTQEEWSRNYEEHNVESEDFHSGGLDRDKIRWIPHGDSYLLDIESARLEGKSETSQTVAEKKFYLPAIIYNQLRPYQRHGVAWMWSCFIKGKGGILADEMGLGKTVMTCAFVAGLIRSKLGTHMLVVLPGTLTENWRAEIKKWISDQKEAIGFKNVGGDPRNGDKEFFVRFIHGIQSEGERADNIAKIARCGGALLVTYDMVQRALEAVGSVGKPMKDGRDMKRRKKKKGKKQAISDDDLSSEEEEHRLYGNRDMVRRQWDIVICDEAHQVQNRLSESAKSMRNVSARSKFLLTGTPYRNHLAEIWSLSDLAMPGLLGNFQTFERNFAGPITIGFKRNATIEQVLKKDQLTSKLKNLLGCYLLRRTKEELSKKKSSSSISSSQNNAGSNDELQLPPRRDICLFCTMSDIQLKRYKEYLGLETVKKAREKHSIEAFKAIDVLKKISNSPSLVLPRSVDERRFGGERQGPEEKDDLGGMLKGRAKLDDANQMQAELQADIEYANYQAELEYLNFSDADVKQLCPESTKEFIDLSCKLRLLNVLLPALVQRGHRILIFSSYTRMLTLVQNIILKTHGILCLRLDGGVNAGARQQKVQKFNTKPEKFKVMLLSTKVGGVGLTLTSADRVILIEPAWSPAVDQQAIDRAHRLTQTKEVVCYRLISYSSIEDKMFRVQVFKQGLMKTVLEKKKAGMNQQRHFAENELKKIFTQPDDEEDCTLKLLGCEDNDSLKVAEVLGRDVGAIEHSRDDDPTDFWANSGLKGLAFYNDLFKDIADIAPENEELVKITEEVEGAVHQLKSEKYIVSSDKPVVRRRNKNPGEKSESSNAGENQNAEPVMDANNVDPLMDADPLGGGALPVVNPRASQFLFSAIDGEQEEPVLHENSDSIPEKGATGNVRHYPIDDDSDYGDDDEESLERQLTTVG